MAPKEPESVAETEEAGERWLANVGGWKKRWVDGMRNRIAHLQETLAESERKRRTLERECTTLWHRLKTAEAAARRAGAEQL